MNFAIELFMMLQITEQAAMDAWEWPDIHRLQAAIGWLELGAFSEANQELQKITPQLRSHPSFLKILWAVYARSGCWAAALVAAITSAAVAPDEPQPWLNLAFSLDQLNHTREARDNLLAVAGRFPESGWLRYSLACYESKLGNLAEARNWLLEALASPAGEELSAFALQDSDLAPVWATFWSVVPASCSPRRN